MMTYHSFVYLKISDLRAIRVSSFSRSKDVWPTWSEKFLAMAKSSGIKVVLLGKVLIPKSSEFWMKRQMEAKEC
jgi:hypothetical protein